MRDGKALVEAGYYQTSSRYRMVGRVPPGKAAKDALFEKEMEETLKVKGLPEEKIGYWRMAHREWVEMLGEGQCTDYYIRTYADDDNALTLTPEEWRSFKAAGGRCAGR